MGLEIATYISDLNVNNPVGAVDPVAQGDDHLRLIKSALQNTFPNINGAVTLTPAQLNDAALRSAPNTFTALNTFVDGVNVQGIDGSGVLSLIAGSARNTFFPFHPGRAGAFWWITNPAFSLGMPLTIEGSAIHLIGAPVTLNGVAASDFARLSVGQTFTANNVFRVTGNTTMLTLESEFPDGGFVRLERTGVGAYAYIGNSKAVIGPGGTLDDLHIYANQRALLQGGGGVVIQGIPHTDFARLSQANAFTLGAGNASPDISLRNANPTLHWNETDAAADNRAWFANVRAESFQFGVVNDANSAATAWLTVDRTGVAVDSIAMAATALSLSGALTTPNASAAEVGFKGLPIVHVAANRAVVASDAGKSLFIDAPATGVSIATGAVPDGAAFMVVNALAGSVTLTETPGANLYLAGSGVAGNRTIGPNGYAVIFYAGSGTFLVSGPGVS